MAITPVNITRVSQNMQRNLMISSVQNTMVNLLKTQEQLAAGLRILRPSDDPVDATAIIRMDEIVEAQQQYLANIDHASKAMNLADSAVTSMRDLIVQAHDIALENIGSTATEEQRQSASILVNSIINQLVTLGNTEYLGSFLFAGKANTSPPFAIQGNNVQFTGDFDPLTVQVNDGISEPMSITADELFGTGSGKVVGAVSLEPFAELDSRLSDFKGAYDQGIRLGKIKIIGSVIGEVEVDLTGSATLRNILDKINNALPPSVRAILGPDGKRIFIKSSNPSELLQVLETGSGTAAHDLGIYTPVSVPGEIKGDNIKPKLTPYTKISNLCSGRGIDKNRGIIIRNGDQEARIDFVSCQTLQDILNTINTAGVGVTARISEDEERIEIVSQIAGADLYIGENGGTTARDLGIRTFNLDTQISDLNDGLGINTVDGADFKITTADGSEIEVDVSDVETIRDVIDRINSSSGGKVTASLATFGNGIVLTDNTTGSEIFRVERANLSNAAEDLGILKEAPPLGSTIVGDDVNPIREDSIFTYLIDLRDGLSENDTKKIEISAQRIEEYMDRLNQAHGKLGFMARGLETRKTRMEDAVLATKSLLSNLQDLDYTSAITKLQNYQTALQAALMAGARTIRTTLLDYL